MRIGVKIICLFFVILAVSATAMAQCDPSCPGKIVAYHAQGKIAPVTDTITYSTVQYDEKCWILQNLGATQQADSATDASEDASGWYWQFNRKQGYRISGASRTPNTVWITSIDEDLDWLPENDPCALLLGGGWRIPTSEEWESADEIAGGNWLTLNDAYDSSLKLHYAGYLSGNTGAPSGPGGIGDYWGSTKGAETFEGSSFYINNTSVFKRDYTKSFGFTVRCCKTL